MPGMVDNALVYAARGWKIFPLRPKTKEPFAGIGVYSATNDVDQIRAWWKKWPDANIGLHCGGSGLIAIDLDSYKDQFDDIALDYKTLSSLTGGGGQHIIYAMPAGKRYGGKTGGLAKQAIDIRGWGGYIVLPPSTHPNGRAYTWEIEFSPEEIEVAPLPDHIRKLLDDAYVEQQTTAEVFAECAVSHAAPDLRGFRLKSAVLELIHAGPTGDRSQTDAKIVTALVNAGASNGDILNVYSHYPCGADGKFAERGQSYLAQTIRNARTFTGVFEPGYYPGFGPDVPEMWERGEAAPDEPPKPVTVSEIIASFALALGAYALCEMDGRVYINNRPAEDADIAPLKISVYDWNGLRDPKGSDPFLPVGGIEPVVLNLAGQNRFHPIRDWLNSLRWDGESHIHNLCAHFTDAHKRIIRGKHSYSVFEALFSRWLIGAVQRAFTGAQNPVLVLAGMQGIGKSFLPGWLARPVAIANGYGVNENPYFCEGNINPESVDHQRRLVSKFIWEIGEVGATMRRADQDALKQFITEGAATFRVPFARYDVTKPALCSWIATVNPTTGFLSDPTGNRRFRTVELKAIDWTYSQNVDASQVWAQAMHWWRDLGWTPDLNAEEKIVVENINADHTTTDDETEALLERYEFDASKTTPDWSVYTADVVDDLIRNVAACKTTNITRVGRALSRLTKTSSKRLKGDGFDGRSGYHGVRKITEVDAAKTELSDMAWRVGV